MTQKYNLQKYERATKLILNAVGISPEQLGFLEKIIKLEEDKSHVHEIRVGFAHPQNVYGLEIHHFQCTQIDDPRIDSYLKKLHLLIDVNVNSKEFAYKDYVKNYLKKKRIYLKSGKPYCKSTHRDEYTYRTDYDKFRGKLSKKVYTHKYSANRGRLYQRGRVNLDPVTFFRPYKEITVSVSKNKRNRDGEFPHDR